MGGSNQIKVAGERHKYTAGRGGSARTIQRNQQRSAPQTAMYQPAQSAQSASAEPQRPALRTGAQTRRGKSVHPAEQMMPASSTPAKNSNRNEEIDKLLWGDASAAASLAAATLAAANVAPAPETQAAESAESDGEHEEPKQIKTQPKARRRGGR